MKNIILISIAVFITAGFLFTGCEKETDRPPVTMVDTAKVLEIKDIYQIHADSGDNYVFTEDYMLYATVVMDDSTGNIYKEAYLQDSTGGINLYKLSSARALKTGQYVRINLIGASILNYSGKLELVFTNVLDFGKNAVVQNQYAPIDPKVVTVEEIMTGNYNGMLVDVQGIQFKDDELTKTYYSKDLQVPLDQNRYAVDCSGNEIIVRTSSYATFAKDTVPGGNGNAIGVITKFQKVAGGDIDWQLLIRNTDEVSLENPRCGATE